MFKLMFSCYNFLGDEYFFDVYDESDYESSLSIFSLYIWDSSFDFVVKFYDVIDGEVDNYEFLSFKREVGFLLGFVLLDWSKSDYDVIDIED